jgi:prefoldin subunit 5
MIAQHEIDALQARIAALGQKIAAFQAALRR